MTLTAASVQDYFQEGQEAFRTNKPKTDNPYDWSQYPNLQEAASHWDQGWESERKASYGDD